MPITISCNECRKQVTIAEDMDGKLVRCPHCQNTFIARANEHAVREPPRPDPSREEPRNEPGGEELPRRRLATPYDEHDFDDDLEMEDLAALSNRAPGYAWAGVRSSLQIMYVTSIILGFFGMMYFALMAMTSFGGFAGGAVAGVFGLLGCFAFFAVLGCGVAILVSLLTALNTPRESGARRFIVGCLVCLGVYVVTNFFQLFFLSFVLGMGGPWDPETTSFLALLGPFVAMMVFLAAFVFYLLFLRAIAAYFNDTSLANRCKNFGIFFGIFYTLSTGVLLLIIGFGPAGLGLFNAGGPEGAAIVLLLCLGLVGLGAFYWFIVLLGQTRDLIDEQVSMPPNY